jgi:hypothetical protein
MAVTINAVFITVVTQIIIEFAVLDEFFEPVVADDRIEALDCVGVELARD